MDLRTTNSIRLVKNIAEGVVASQLCVLITSIR
jgi:hypothetical protein